MMIIQMMYCGDQFNPDDKFEIEIGGVLVFLTKEQVVKLRDHLTKVLKNED